MNNINSLIDHTLLSPFATKEQIEKLCSEAKEYGFASVCINPCHVKLASSLLKGSNVKVCTVIGFPLGASTTATKSFEVKDAIENGATEVDMVINIGALKDEDYQYVENDIRKVVEASSGAIVKVILETCYLDDTQKGIACKLCSKAGAKFVKTSTGFGTGGATVEDVKLMRQNISPDMEVKASGGIRTAEDAKKMMEAGASRLGTSSGVKISETFKGESCF